MIIPWCFFEETTLEDLAAAVCQYLRPMDVLFLLPASSRCLGAWGIGFLTWHRGWAPWYAPLFEHGCTGCAAGIHIATFPKSWACQWVHHSQHHWQRFKNILREKVCNLDRIPFKWHKGLKVEGSESELSLKNCGLSEIRIPQVLWLIIIFCLQRCIHHFQTYLSIISLHCRLQYVAVYIPSQSILSYPLCYRWLYTTLFSFPSYLKAPLHHRISGCSIWLEARRHSRCSWMVGYIGYIIYTVPYG